MDTVIFDVTTLENFLGRAKAAAQSGLPGQTARVSFATPQRLLHVLSENRMGMLKVMAGAGALGVRELARRVGRDVRAVHADATVLRDAGVIERTARGKLLFPYRRVKVEFTLDADNPDTDPPVAQRARKSTGRRTAV